MNFTNEELRATYAKMIPYRENWPGTFDEAMRLPLVATVLRGMTAHPRALASWLAYQTSGNIPKGVTLAAQRTVQPRVLQTRKTLPALDWKRRASGEKEND